MQDKNTQRLSLLQQRKILTKQVIADHSTAICNQLINLSEFQKSQMIGVYWPLTGEIDTHSIISKCWELAKVCYLPKIGVNLQMDFCRYDKDTTLKINQMKIPEPINKEMLSPTDLDLVLIPLVAFDAKGHRLGFGAGYYDRCFAFRKNLLMAKPWLVGLAHSFQEVNAIHSDPWDVNLDLVLTEKNVIYPINLAS